MSEKSVAVVDTNVLLNLALPVVDSRPKAPSGADPLKALLAAYDVHVPESVLGELTDATGVMICCLQLRTSCSAAQPDDSRCR